MIDVDHAPADSHRSAPAPVVAPARRARRVLFLGTHGQANIGDELLLTTFLRQLGDEHRYTVNSYSPERTRARLEPDHDVEVFATTGDRRSLVRHLLRCDAVVFGGGSIVNTSSGSAQRGDLAIPAYAVSKGGVVEDDRLIGRRYLVGAHVALPVVRLTRLT